MNSEIIKSLTDAKNNIEKHKNWFYCVKLCYSLELVPSLDKCKRISRAFYKLYEMREVMDNAEHVYCLCEAPGGFAEAVLSFRKTSTLLAQSIGDIKFSSKLNSKYIDTNRDITKFENVLSIIKTIRTSFQKCNLITADGGIDVSSDYLNQEKLNTKLILCEIYIAIHSLRPKGNFILKVFDCFTLPMIQLLWILEEYFEKVEIRKLHLSRPCNSEKYVICTGFIDDVKIKHLHKFILDEKSIIEDLEIDIPTEFIQRMNILNRNFATTQIKFLNETAVFCTSNNVKSLKLKQLKMSKLFLDNLKIP